MYSLLIWFDAIQRSALERDVIQIDKDTKDMLDAMNFKDLAGVHVDVKA